jgi:hypothetical protein
LETGQLKEAPWLTALGAVLSRVELESEGETKRVRALANSLANTRWQSERKLEIIPYIDGTPAGTARHGKRNWRNACRKKSRKHSITKRSKRR